MGARLLQRTSRWVSVIEKGVRLPVMTGASIVASALFAFAACYPRIVLELHLTNA